MKSFEASDFFPFWPGSKLSRRSSLHSFSAPRKPSSMIYMVPTTPSKPAMLMKPNTYQNAVPSVGAGGGGGYYGHDYLSRGFVNPQTYHHPHHHHSHAQPPHPSHHHLRSNSFLGGSSYPSPTRFERFPTIHNNGPVC